jgi:hypothetical protein
MHPICRSVGKGTGYGEGEGVGDRDWRLQAIHTEVPVPFHAGYTNYYSNFVFNIMSMGGGWGGGGETVIRVSPLPLS